MEKWSSCGLGVIPFVLLVAGGCKSPMQIEFQREEQINGSAQPLFLDIVTIYSKDIKDNSRWDPKAGGLDSKSYFEEHGELAGKLPPAQIKDLQLLGTDKEKRSTSVPVDVPLGKQFWDKPMIYIFGRFQNASNALVSTQPVVLRDVLTLPRPVVIHVGKEGLTYKGTRN